MLDRVMTGPDMLLLSGVVGSLHLVVQLQRSSHGLVGFASALDVSASVDEPLIGAADPALAWLAQDTQVHASQWRLPDGWQVRQVIHNLLSNARDAVAPQQAAGVIRVAAHRVSSEQGDDRTAVRFTVSDSGPGFTPQVLARATEPYVTTKSHGTGLGLAIVRKIVKEHGGRLDIDNRRDGGAKISILWRTL